MTMKRRSKANVPNRIEQFVQVVKSTASWHDLDLSKQQCEVIRAIVARIQQQSVAMEPSGTTVLFVGSGSTGKTMASEVIANELHLDLYRIYLSQVVNKYIGETEKNLKRIFDATEDSGAILFFDEADALFGKRSEVRDSHDRYANIEINYLLECMRTFQGFAILSTNRGEALDADFQRRFNYVVDFPGRSQLTTVPRKKKRKGSDDA